MPATTTVTVTVTLGMPAGHNFTATAATGYICTAFTWVPWPARDLTGTDNFNSFTYYYMAPGAAARPGYNGGNSTAWPIWQTAYYPGYVNPPVLGSGSLVFADYTNCPHQVGPVFASQRIYYYRLDGGQPTCYLELGSFGQTVCGFFDPTAPGAGGITGGSGYDAGSAGPFLPVNLTFTYNINGTYYSGYIYGGTGTVLMTE